MNTFKLILGTAAMTLMLFMGCKEDAQLMFDDSVPKVYIDKRWGGTLVDSANYSFAFQHKSIITDTIQVPLRILGLQKDYERKVSLVLSAGSSAVEGYHFKIENAIIPANASDGIAELIFYRKPGLKDSTVFGEIKVAANTDFQPGYNDKAISAALDRLTYRFYLTDKLDKPSNWETYWKNLFGDYSKTKILFLTELLQYTNWNVGGLYPQDSNQMVAKARLGVYEYEKANGPMLDENGNRVIIP